MPSAFSAVDLAAAIADHVQHILMSSNTADAHLLFDPESYLSDDRLMEVAVYAIRDLLRVEIDQDNGVSISKILGYIGFWFAKLKPLNSVHVIKHAENSSLEREVNGINEAVALLLIERLFKDFIFIDSKLIPQAWIDCPISNCVMDLNGGSIRGRCYFEKNRKFLTSFNNKHRNYIVYSMRFRSFSPYFLVNYLDQAIVLSCESTCPPLRN